MKPIKPTKQKIVVIDGNVGSGKSTLAVTLAEKLTAFSGEQWAPLLEPADTDEYFKELLAAHLEDPEDLKMSIRFQKYIADMNYDIMKEALANGTNIVAERSLWTGSIFMESGSLPEFIKDAINLYMDTQLGDYPEIDYAVYLKRDYMACFDSMKQRGRQCETSGYDIKQFKRIEEAHGDMHLATYINRATWIKTFGSGVYFANPNVLASRILQDLAK